MPVTVNDTAPGTGARQGLRLDLRTLPDRIEDTAGGSLIGRHWGQAQLYWSEYLDLTRRFAGGYRLTGADRARLWQLIGAADDEGGTDEATA